MDEKELQEWTPPAMEAFNLEGHPVWLVGVRCPTLQQWKRRAQKAGFDVWVVQVSISQAVVRVHRAAFEAITR